MATRRIPKTPTAVRDVLRRAAKAASTVPDWPASAPSAAELNSLADDLDGTIQEKAKLRSQLKQVQTAERVKTQQGIEAMHRVDSATDSLYTPRGPQKAEFGLPPKKPTHGHSVPLAQPLIRKITDGAAPGSLLLDWDTVDGAAAYQVEWYTDAEMLQKVGNAAATSSKHLIKELQPGEQYWVWVRAVRGKQTGHWSDPATRIANL